MSKSTLQVPVDTRLRSRAEKAAADAGFSSIQEVIRVFLKRFASRSVEVQFRDTDSRIELSPKAEVRYTEILKDATKGKNIVKAKSFEDLMTNLE